MKNKRWIRKRELCWTVLLLCVFTRGNAYTLNLDLSGQLSGWTIQSRNDDEWRNQTGGRYLPQLTLEHQLTTVSFMDIETSLNGFATYDTERSEEEIELELYRLKLRYATAQTETQLGLQRINFGPAQLLRSLKWFDQVDPRDQLQLTNGVYALRFKYGALNNANLWLWGLYGNDERKGYEQLPSVDDTPEFGGRLQYPVLDGELASTFHTRKVDALTPGGSDFREDRIALDGRWEITVGLWFETMLQHQEASWLPYEWTKMTTIGADYTFGVGNGLHVVLEHLTTVAASDAFGWDEDAHISAFSLSYPYGLFDNFSAIGYYSWEQEQYWHYLSWQRTYNTWSMNASLFSYPASETETLDVQQTALGAGYGAQVMFTFYH
ncbi:hypothetical protein U27_00670 [Candidatus Vecturithrix granuli]|uniref:Uncharacterized protein n=1 Tax=Vecturithrix granuli TaxID=1499967 RepID=A0A081C867_VECG1|nr:hypothetical protein U27_00670 [Candidatus Vecturithrix granuli]